MLPNGYCDCSVDYVFQGALYPDNTTNKQKEDDRLQPGAQYTYKWYVEEKQGPGPNDSNCVTRIYHSHVDTPRDVASGLVGPILTCKRGIVFLKSHCSQRTRISRLSPALLVEFFYQTSSPFLP